MESALYGIYALVRFLIQKERVHKYYTPALSMKYSVFIFGIQLMRRDILALKSYQSSMT